MGEKVPIVGNPYDLTLVCVELHQPVTQGTVLGPLLFLVYINDMPYNIISTTRLFADDSLVSG